MAPPPVESSSADRRIVERIGRPYRVAYGVDDDASIDALPIG
jgi:hypothetical protein